MRKRPMGLPARSRRCVVASMILIALIGTGCDATRSEAQRGAASVGSHASVADPTPAGEPLPVWLSGRPRVVHERGVTLVGGDHGDLQRVAAMAVRAARHVRSALPGRLPVVRVVLPPDAETALRLLGSPAQELHQIAAVTATVDDSDDRQAPVQVVLNAPVFESLDRQTARFVLAHEMTHALTGATTSPMPLWVAEGFADYVALRKTSLPVTVTAGQVLAQVVRFGPPRRLPTEADFARQAPSLGTAYEAAWLAFRMLAQEYGHAATLQFYLAVRDDVPLQRALDEAFDLDVRALTAAWRSYLSGLA